MIYELSFVVVVFFFALCCKSKFEGTANFYVLHLERSQKQLGSASKAVMTLNVGKENYLFYMTQQNGVSFFYPQIPGESSLIFIILMENVRFGIFPKSSRFFSLL